MQNYAGARTDDLATYMTIPEAAAWMRCSPDTIRRRIKSGDLPAILFAGKYRITVAALEDMLRKAAA